MCVCIDDLPPVPASHPLLSSPAYREKDGREGMGMSRKKSRDPALSERSSRRSRGIENRGGEGKGREAGSLCIVWIAYWNKEGHVEGGTSEIPISERKGERNAECEREALCMCEGVLHVCVCVYVMRFGLAEPVRRCLCQKASQAVEEL